MRFLIFILLAWSFIGLSSAGIIYVGPDHPKLLKEADLVAVLRLKTMADTGTTKALTSESPLAFHEFKATFEVLTVFKGDADAPLALRMHRFPTLEEAVRQLGDEGRRQLSIIHRHRNIHIHLMTPTHAKEYLAYLKKQEDGTYIPVGDPTMTVVSFLELKVSF